MPTTSTVEMFFIGNFADMDTNESDFDNENPNIVLGTYSDPVYMEVSEIDVNDDAVINDDEFGSGDYLSYDTGGGALTVDLDNSSLYNADILLGDGSTVSVPVLVIQAANGDVFISEFPANPLDGLSIQSITLVSLITSDASGINAGASDVENASVVCYSSGTTIETPRGPRAVETLEPGDLVMTQDRGPQPILWTRMSEHALDALDREKRPVFVRAGALGPGRPEQDLIVSPQHRILVGVAGQLEDVFANEVFVPAKALTILPGVRHMNGKSRIEYVHFACARHEVICANGCLSESLLLGPVVQNALAQSERDKMAGIFARAPTPDGCLNGPPARNCLPASVARRCITGCRDEERRHAKAGIKARDRTSAEAQSDTGLLSSAGVSDGVVTCSGSQPRPAASPVRGGSDKRPGSDAMPAREIVLT